MALWIGCMMATCYGHAIFFVMAQKHSGDVRAAIVPIASVPGRNLAAIASDRAGVIGQLARVAERKCGDRCAAVRIERTTLDARLAALNIESAEATRRELALDRTDAERAAARADPLAGLLTDFGVAAGRVDLIAGIAFAVVIEGVACFCWLVALLPARATAAASVPRNIGHRLSVTRVASASAAIPIPDNDVIGIPANSSVNDQATYLTLISAAIEDGLLRCTVAEIRKYLRCSQATAAALRKQFAQKGAV